VQIEQPTFTQKGAGRGRQRAALAYQRFIKDFGDVAALDRPSRARQRKSTLKIRVKRYLSIS
jgi:hypothetical protein